MSSNINLDTSTYDILRTRLNQQAEDLALRLSKLNTARKDVFGAVETDLIANDRIHTSNYCLARDIVAIGDTCIFGYNVHVGLRAGIQLKDVFSGYVFENQRFKETNLDILQDEKFLTDFQNLYRYYKDAFFARFTRQGRYLYMVFHLNTKTADFKAFKWLVTDDGLRYVDNRSDQEVRFPEQYEFRWRMATRDDQRHGRHPHVSILERVFVETIGGDLTIKVEDNTTEGHGIYSEPVEYHDQTLDDAEFAYADLGNLILLRIKPYQEESRYFVFNEKIQQVQRVDTLAQSGILLPEGQGIVFANGFYLQTGEYKLFDKTIDAPLFRGRISAPNGEDHLFVFYNRMTGLCVLLPYNIIQQQVATPVVCNGFTLFPGGELCYFRAEQEPVKHHVMQIWQTPFAKEVIVPEVQKDNYLYKIGNQEIVRAMAECQEILTLCAKDDSYANLYDDLVQRTTAVLDAYYWIADERTFNLSLALKPLKATATTAIEEFDKKSRTAKQTRKLLEDTAAQATKLFDSLQRERFDHIDTFVAKLAALRTLRGQLLSLRELPFTDEQQITQLEASAQQAYEKLAANCVQFLLNDDALNPYELQIAQQADLIEGLSTAAQAVALETAFDEIGKQLELLVDMVGNLKIEDATHTTRIIDAISALFTHLNQHKAVIRQKAKTFRNNESAAEFGAQLKLLDQSFLNYLDLADSPERCDEFLTKIMVQLEELDSKFADVEDFAIELAEKREAILTTLESRRNQLIEARNNRTAALFKAAERIFKGIENRTSRFSELDEINAFFASDLMVDKVRDIIRQLYALEDSNKADRIQTQLKTIQEDAVRALRDRKDLFVSGDNVIQLGRHRFSVNNQPLELTVVHDEDELVYHLTGTHFYQPIEDEVLYGSRSVWKQQLVSENDEVYRAAYLAYSLLDQARSAQWPHEASALLPLVQQAAATRYTEGYTKGIHDEDATHILSWLLQVREQAGGLVYAPLVRAMAMVWWNRFAEATQKNSLVQALKSAGEVLKVFPATSEFGYIKAQLLTSLKQFAAAEGLFPDYLAAEAADYLFEVMAHDGRFVISQQAAEQWKSFETHLKKQKAWPRFIESLKWLEEQPRQQYLLTRKWVMAWLEMQQDGNSSVSADEMAAMRQADCHTIAVAMTATIPNMRGDHKVINHGTYFVDYHAFMQQMQHFAAVSMPLFEEFTARKRALTQTLREELQLNEFTPKVLTSFVRNQLIDQVYLPIIGDNLAKQIGTVGDQTRTDRMGLLLLISPPGYGKTTLMEYIAQRLGLIFVKVNGPAIGHSVTSLAPHDATSMAARKELEKLNLALEMGDNIMLYVDDIQHCHPEFLQKFISLCDAQRKIEGVYNGRSRTYDLRGRRVAVVMAGNPYTEQGTRFQVPDMLANRADIYNLGDIIGDKDKAFKLSYIENALTSNPVLAPLATRRREDVLRMITGVETARTDELQLEGTYTTEELREYLNVLTKLLHVRDVVLNVNKAYIASAAMSDDYRTEPPFKLQGSYRNMNKMAEKVSAVMNAAELNTMILAHYEGEVQTLTADAEANFLKLKALLGLQNDSEEARWHEIRETFRKNNRFAARGDNMQQLLAQLNAFQEGLEGIRQALEKGSKTKIE
ncbi:MAG: DNA repair ATPase [Saprospiraceae bacterium]